MLISDIEGENSITEANQADNLAFYCFFQNISYSFPFL